MVSPKRPTDGSHLLPWLGGIAAVLTLVLLWDRQSDTAPAESAPSPTMATEDVGSSTRQPASTRDPTDASSLNPLASLGLNSLRDTVGRPLFEKNRRPVEPTRKIEAPTPPAAQRAPDQAALTLLGVLKSKGKAIALFKRNQTGQNVRAEEGDTIDGWTVKQIDYQRVVLSQRGREIALQMFVKQRR
jgi:hypothetical protein